MGTLVLNMKKAKKGEIAPRGHDFAILCKGND